jgi:asparagine synthase (glutamine-hydrolysing)
LRSCGIDGHLGEQLQALATLLPMDGPESWYAWLSSEWNDSALPVLSAATPDYLFQAPSGGSVSEFLDEVRLYEATTQLPGDFLVKVDRATAFAGLRSRMPYLDPAVFLFVWELPDTGKYDAGDANKMLLRELLYRYVPRTLVDRPKQGFSIPLGPLLKTKLRDWAEGLLCERRLRTEGFFDARLIRRLWNEYLTGEHDREDSLWVVLMFEAWHARNRESPSQP